MTTVNIPFKLVSSRDGGIEVRQKQEQTTSALGYLEYSGNSNGGISITHYAQDFMSFIGDLCEEGVIPGFNEEMDRDWDEFLKPDWEMATFEIGGHTLFVVNGEPPISSALFTQLEYDEYPVDFRDATASTEGFSIEKVTYDPETPGLTTVYLVIPDEMTLIFSESCIADRLPDDLEEARTKTAALVAEWTHQWKFLTLFGNQQ
jgi:hypothetical protein